MRLLFALGLAASGLWGCSGSDSGAGGSGGSGGGAGSEAVLRLSGKSETELCTYYAQRYPVSSAPAVTGSDLSCVAGTITAEGVAQYRQRIDFYREWLGLTKTDEPDPSLAEPAQDCAMMMGVAEKLSHNPSTDWPCYTAAGAETAGDANLGYAYASPAQSIDVFMFDFGNEDDPGHRRWLLYPQFAGLGYGWFDAGPGGKYGRLSASCVVTFKGSMDLDLARTPAPVAYPPAGAFPRELAAITNLATPYRVPWSLSWQGADFSGATLKLVDEKTGQPVPLELELHPLQAYVGTDAAGWLPAPIPAMGDRWSVRIEGVKLDGIDQLPIVYEVEMVDCGATPIFP
ncbi:MAG: hypothetical protein AMXMBFR56_22100 [Polyangiaceae bacterium]